MAVAGVGAEHAHATDQHRHLGGAEGQQLGLVHQHGFRELCVVTAQEVAKTVGEGFEHGKGVDIRLRLGGVHATRREGHSHCDARQFGRLLDADAAGQHDQIGQGDLLATGGRGVEPLLDAF
ncbi:hypothetical protein D3C86_995880 [compost metagenome]